MKSGEIPPYPSFLRAWTHAKHKDYCKDLDFSSRTHDELQEKVKRLGISIHMYTCIQRALPKLIICAITNTTY